MFPLGSEGGFHFRMIWDEELETDIGSNGTDGTAWEEAEVTALPCQSLAKQGPAQANFHFCGNQAFPGTQQALPGWAG